jgi:hypothetical protein
MISASFEWKPSGRSPGKGTEQAALHGLRQAGELVLERSNRMVPLEEGTLERSGRVTDNGRDEVAVSYDTPYARVQHEDMTLRHDNGRSAKFLEKAHRQSRGEIAKLVAAAVRKALGT